ncbi:MAG TPA: hypothetical protein DEP42_03685 [Ruminococcaceae bacterium]|nr:hypothetical protein [Oscillospiraceae bacterium]
MRRTILAIALFLTVAIGLSGMPVLAWEPATPVSSNAVYLVNSDTGSVIYEKNATQKIYPASITKLTTSLVVMDKYANSLDTVITVTKEDLATIAGTGSSVLGLKVGEQISVRQLLHGMLIKSGNDCAVVLARATSGSIPNFVSAMNAKAKKLGATHTHYANPDGLHDPNHYTTAADVYKIAHTFMSSDFLADVVDTPSYTVPATNVTPAVKIQNTNSLIVGGSPYYLSDVKGIKTGTTTEAGACLVSIAQRKALTYYAIVMGGTETTAGSTVNNTAFADTKALYQWVLKDFKMRQLLDTTTPQEQVPLQYASKQKNITLVPEKQFNSLLPTSVTAASVKLVPHNLPKQIAAPVKQGQRVCTADVMLNNQKLGTIWLVASQDAARSTPLYIMATASAFFNSIWFKIVCVLIDVLFILYLVWAHNAGHRRRGGRGQNRGNYRR